MFLTKETQILLKLIFKSASHKHLRQCEDTNLRKYFNSVNIKMIYELILTLIKHCYRWISGSHGIHKQPNGKQAI